MFDLPHQSARDKCAKEVELAARRPRLLPGEIVEGWVVAEITPYPRPFRAVSLINVDSGPESFMAAPRKTNDIYLQMQSTPPLAQFVLAVVEYPSGPVARWGRLCWPAVEIVLRSPHEWTAVAGDAPPATPELCRLAEELAHRAVAQGWEPAGRGSTWCSQRFRRPYGSLGRSLRWK